MAAYRMQESIPPVVKNLLIINGLIFLAQFVTRQRGIHLEEWGALWTLDSGNFKVWQLVTHMFMHGDFWHLLFNMFGLWSFGRFMEDAWGSKRFLEFYLLCGLIAGLTHILFTGGGGYAVGASGAIMGVFAGFAYLYPNAPLMLMFIPVPVKAKYMIPALMLIDVFGQIDPSPTDNVAHLAHLGGAAAGFLLTIWYTRKSRRSNY